MPSAPSRTLAGVAPALKPSPGDKDSVCEKATRMEWNSSGKGGSGFFPAFQLGSEGSERKGTGTPTVQSLGASVARAVVPSLAALSSTVPTSLAVHWLARGLFADCCVRSQDGDVPLLQ